MIANAVPTDVLVDWGPPAGLLLVVLIGCWKMFNRGIDTVSDLGEKNRQAVDQLAKDHAAALEKMEERHRQERKSEADLGREAQERQSKALDGVAAAMLELAKKNGDGR